MRLAKLILSGTLLLAALSPLKAQAMCCDLDPQCFFHDGSICSMYGTEASYCQGLQGYYGACTAPIIDLSSSSERAEEHPHSDSAEDGE